MNDFTLRVTGYRRFPRGIQRPQLFAQTGTLRIRQSHSLDFSNEGSTSPLQAIAILAMNNFHKLARADGPK